MSIKSQLDALRIKTCEKEFYEFLIDKKSYDEKVILKLTPFLGINLDMLYFCEGKILFIKFMDTSEELFSILDEELIEVMHEEYALFCENMKKSFLDISYNYVFVMPNVFVKNYYEYEDFCKNNIIDKKTLQKIFDDKNLIKNYLKNENDEVSLSIMLTKICPEYFVMNDKLHLNKYFKKLSFSDNNLKYDLVMLEESQIQKVCSINYNETNFEGSYSTSKTTIAFSRCLKLARIYPHHRFLFLTDKKQKCNQLKEKLEFIYPECKNIQIYTFDKFVIKLSKKLNLFIDYNLLKQDYQKTIYNLTKQIKNALKDKKIFKGIFIDNTNNFSDFEIDFVKSFLYKNKYIFNTFYNKCGDTSSKFNVFEEKQNLKSIILSKNYCSSKSVNRFINNFSENSNEFINNLTKSEKPVFYKTKCVKNNLGAVNLIKVEDLEEQLDSVIWEINYFVKSKGIDYSDICVVYPYNKKKLKNKNTIYFQYLLKKELEKSKIDYVEVEDSLTNLTKKNGVSISNIYSLGDLSFKVLIICELEMLYNHKITDNIQDYKINDFVSDLNKFYLMINKSCDYLSIVTSFDEKNSDIIKLINKSLN